ncbi:MAG: hypothetical protein ACRDSJ_06635 [Rubrobacteraceae bacterium]
MARKNLATSRLAQTEEAINILFRLVEEARRNLNPKGQSHQSLKKLSDSEVLTLILLRQLRGVESERSLLREAERFFARLLPGVAGLRPSSFHRGARGLRRWLEPSRKAILGELAGDPETMIIDSALVEALHPREVSQSSGFDGAAWVRWGSFSVRGVKPRMLAATNRVPASCELTPANVAEARLAEELLAEARLGEGVARRLPADLAYRGGMALQTERAERRPGLRRRIEMAFSSLKRVFGLGETLATTLVGLATRIAAKVTAYTYAFLVNRMLGRPQGRIKDLWA